MAGGELVVLADIEDAVALAAQAVGGGDGDLGDACHAGDPTQRGWFRGSPPPAGRPRGGSRGPSEEDKLARTPPGPLAALDLQRRLQGLAAAQAVTHQLASHLGDPAPAALTAGTRDEAKVTFGLGDEDGKLGHG
jgi:hypothetical protein